MGKNREWVHVTILLLSLKWSHKNALSNHYSVIDNRLEGRKAVMFPDYKKSNLDSPDAWKYHWHYLSNEELWFSCWPNNNDPWRCIVQFGSEHAVDWRVFETSTVPIFIWVLSIFIWSWVVLTHARDTPCFQRTKASAHTACVTQTRFLFRSIKLSDWLAIKTSHLGSRMMSISCYKSVSELRSESEKWGSKDSIYLTSFSTMANMTWCTLIHAHQTIYGIAVHIRVRSCHLMTPIYGRTHYHLGDPSVVLLFGAAAIYMKSSPRVCRWLS